VERGGHQRRGGDASSQSLAAEDSASWAARAGRGSMQAVAQDLIEAPRADAGSPARKNRSAMGTLGGAEPAGWQKGRHRRGRVVVAGWPAWWGSAKVIF
jgi:hypothetical protein